ncbi:sensor histidine kinase [Rugamonas aquatica]|uniref:histidine kinase n=1 Tax=Rugamonas aquatica TaxID=2743357 RepID=A0A6A7N0L4_9BURK|nr:sensor histidine kinase [Rugamonas aquatica]MQA38515.1 hypothetical protein [Rugamonas aquatica]
MQPRKKPKPLTAVFKVESALLEELGERLVSSAEVALTELVKNSYDADATYCQVMVNPTEITIEDDGNGMRLDDFLNLWMVIGTRNKARNGLSQKYQRKVSGSKGIGRFAGRFLGEKMVLETVAKDGNGKRRVTAIFDWRLVEANGDLQTVTVPYKVDDVAPSVKVGTTITITELRTRIEPDAVKEISESLLSLVNPVDGFEKPDFLTSRAAAKNRKLDPGFTPYIGVSKLEGRENLASSPAEKILSGFVAKVRIEISDSGDVDLKVLWNRGEEVVHELQSSLRKLYGVANIGSPVLMDIRYFPQRGGVLTSLGIDGRIARSWLTANCGVKVVDNGFRTKPYGDKDDDWLVQSADKAMSARAEWRSRLMKEFYPLTGLQLSPRDNPMLYLPGINQATGMIHVATGKSAVAAVGAVGSPKKVDLILTPSMDRQGFLNNKAFQIVRDLARFGLELIAFYDHKQVREEERRLEAESLHNAEDDLKAAVRDIETSKSIQPAERKRLTGLLKNASQNYAEVDAYRKKTQDSLEIMSLMGVLAGFMTHEFEKTLYRLTESTNIVRKLTKKHPELLPELQELDVSQKYLETYLDYSRLFTESLARTDHKPFLAKEQIEMVMDTLSPIAVKNKISFDIQVDDDTYAPAIPVAAYSGLLLNLMTNSMKSLIARADKAERVIRIIAINTSNKHRLIVADNGIGIPSRLRDRIWEPLFSASTKTDSPLGTGMGLGLALVKRVTNNLKGKVELMDTPPAGFSTSFSLELPRK